MISVIVVYNDERAFNEILLQGLRKQSVKCDLIAIDNANGRFTSAAQALNYGETQAAGKYVMFAHQDIELGTSSWLENAEKFLDDIPDVGIAGVAGMSQHGKTGMQRRRGYISDCGNIWGKPLEKEEEVQTLDECLLIVPKCVFNKLRFDEETFDGWHCYGVDYCLSVRKLGLKAYVIPGFVYHRSLKTNTRNLSEYYRRLYNKHRRSYRRIYTTTAQVCWIRAKLKPVLDLWATLSRRLFPSWTEYLKRELSGCNSVLDIGCGYNSPIQHCRIPFSVGVELFEAYLEESKKKKIHTQYVKGDVRDITFEPRSFDAVLCSELLEHLTKEEGYRLIEKMLGWAKKKVVVTTPNKYVRQDSYDNNPLQEHKSGWSVKELQDLGFAVHGMSGWKKLRNEDGRTRFRPHALWDVVAGMSQKITYRCPKAAYQLFATKRTNGR